MVVWVIAVVTTVIVLRANIDALLKDSVIESCACVKAKIEMRLIIFTDVCF